jgi:hypothetical protein
LRSYEAYVVVNSVTGKVIKKDSSKTYMESEWFNERKRCRVCGWINYGDFNLESQID